MINNLLNELHHLMSKSAFLVKILIRIRNQCNSVIQFYISNSPNSDENGENLIIRSLAHECSQIVDVGANKGEWTAYFLKQKPDIKAVLYDPSYQVSTYLNKRFIDSRSVQVINKAISDVRGNALFFEEPDFGETSSLISSFSSDSSRRVRVLVSTIDDELQQLNIAKVDYLKIDVEGFDYHVLRGAASSLENKKVSFLQFEYNKPWASAGSTLIHAIDYLVGKGYDVYILRKGGLYNFNYKLYGEFFEYSNFFAVLKEKKVSIEGLIVGSI